MRCEVSLVKRQPVKVALPTSSSMQPACPVQRNSGSRNEKTRPRHRKPGLLVCRKEGLIAHECKRGATKRIAAKAGSSGRARREPEPPRSFPAAAERVRDTSKN